MKRFTLALGWIALLALPGLATTPESKDILGSLAEPARGPSLSTPSTQSSGAPAEGKEEAKAPPMRAKEASLVVPDKPQPVSESYFHSDFTAKLIAEHQAHLQSAPGAPGNINQITRERLETLGALAKVILFSYNSTEELRSWRSVDNIFHKLKYLPSHFIHAKFNVPSHLTIPYKGGGEIKSVRIVVTNLDLNKIKSENPFGLVNFFKYDRLTSNIAMIITLRDNTVKIINVQDSSMVWVLFDIFKTRGVFYEQAFMNTGPAMTPDKWLQLPYEKEVDDFYREQLHPRMVTDVLDLTSGHAGAIVMELGAGTGALTMDIFKSLSLAGKEAYVFGTELLAENMESANTAANECVRTPTRRLEFHRCDSMNLLDEFSAKNAEKLNKIDEHFRERHGRKLPLVVVSSGGLNRLVLNSVFESSRVMQNLFRLNPDFMIASGLTETLLTENIIKRTGFVTIAREVIDQGESIFSYHMRSKSLTELLKYHETKLQAVPSLLDLTLSPDPLSVLRGLRPEQLAGIRFLEVSHAFFRGEAEAAGFLELVMASCPKLECLMHQFGLPGDGVQMVNARAGLLAKGVDASFLEKIRSEAMVHEQYLAFSRSFTESLTGNS